MSKRRGVVIGCGFFSVNHLNGWAELKERCDIVAVCDVDRAKAEAAAAKFGIGGVYTDAAQMIAAEKPDFADIITTAPSHRPLVELCAASGIAAIVQKPIALGWDDAVALVAAMAKARRPLMVHENFRYELPFLRALEVLASGEIGRPTWARFSWRTHYDIYKGQPYLAEIDRFILMDIGVHVLDVARAFLGEASEVYCRTQSVRPGIAGEDMATVMLSHADGVTSVCDFTYESKSDPDIFPQTLAIIEGNQGSIRLSDYCRMTVTSPAGTREEDCSPPPLSWGARPWLIVQDSVVAIQRHWLDCLDKGTESATSGADNLKTFALVEACYQSARTGQAVRPLTG